jgi:predicted nucleotidyltransferase
LPVSGVDIDKLDHLLNVLRDLSLTPLPEDMETFVKETMVLPTQHEKTGIRVDFIFSYTPFENNAIKRARAVKILGQKVAFATPEDLIIHKVFAGRPRDLEDVRIVLLKNSDIDVQYIRKWLREFDESSNHDALLENFENILKDIHFFRDLFR